MRAGQHARGFRSPMRIAQKQREIRRDRSASGPVGDAAEYEGGPCGAVQSLRRGVPFDRLDELFHLIVIDRQCRIEWIRQQDGRGLFEILPVVRADPAELLQILDGGHRGIVFGRQGGE